MAGGFSSKWRTMGSNTNGSADPGTSGGGVDGIGNFEDGVSNHQTATGASGTNNQVRKECTMWLVDDGETYTPNFNWVVNSDFTVVMNGTGQTLASDPGNVDVVIQGSLTGGTAASEWVDMRDLGTWDAGTTSIGHLVYDYETYGRMPFMRINVDGDDVDNSAKPFKIVVIPHF
tara:strand:- start:688 stop:1209 length:522 start_codon:yes stop_codon:yes gene_type:complete